jgi:hydrogenase maturation factor
MARIAIHQHEEDGKFKRPFLAHRPPLTRHRGDIRMRHDKAAPSRNATYLRGPMRGGLATTLNEIAQQSGVGMHLQEAAIPCCRR